MSAARVFSSQAPLFFEPNQGQAPPEFRFLLRDGVTQALFRTTGLDLVLPPSSPRTSISVTFVGSDPGTIVNGADLLPGRTNYLLGNDPSRWIHNVANFGEVRYHHLYPGIDAVFYGNSRFLEHDFEIAPHADPSRIDLQLQGASGLDLSSAGDLRIRIAGGNLIFKKPVAYQEINGTRRPVEAGFALAKNSVRFRLGRYDASQKLIIDPVLVYATYLSQHEAVPSAIATDAAGNTYITGTVYVLPFPTTSGALQTSCSGCTWQVAYVTKLNASGAAQVYSTLLGGNGITGTNSIAVDPSGNTIVGGQTEATNFPTKNPFLPPGPNYGGFIVSLTPDGSALNFGALLPGGAVTATNDAEGSVYLTGSTLSGTYPVTSGALNQPGSDGFTFLTKLSTSGSIVASAVIGPLSNVTSRSSSITVDSTGNTFITGTTESTWPVTPGAYQTQPPGSANDIGFIAKVAPDASKFIYSTFIGPGKPVGIALDSNEDAWIADNADLTYPVTTNAFNSYYGPAAFSELSRDGSTLLYSSTVAGNDPPYHNSITAVAIDRNNNVWVAGSGPDVAYPLLDPLISFGDGGYITEFDPTGTKIEFSTLYGGINPQAQLPSIAGIALDPSGKVHVAGATQGGIYVAPGAFLETTQYDGSGYSDYGYVAVIDPNTPAPAVCPNLAALGSPSAYEGGVLQLTNCGTATLDFQSLTTSESSYAITSNSCTGSLSVNASCSLIVQFTPVAGQDCNATLTIASNASLPTVIPLTLGPLTSCPFTSAAAAVSPTSLSFGSQAVKTTSSPQMVTLANPGYGPLFITAITTSQEFPGTTTCGESLAPGASCTVSITFSPLADGLRPAMLTIVDNAGFSPQTVSLSGTGTGPAPSVTLTPTLLDFSVPSLNQTSAPQTVTMTNSGQGPLSIASIGTSPNGGFAQTNTCPSLLAAGANCTIAVTFSTASVLLGDDSLTITDNAVDSPQTVTLWGNVSWVSLAASPAALTIASKGATAQSVIQVTSVGGFTGAVPLSCFIAWEGAGTPSLYPGCTVVPSPANVTSAGASATLTVSTLGGTSSASLRGQPQTLRRSATLLAALLGLVLVPRRRWRGYAMLILTFILLAGGISACGGGSGSTGGGTGGGSGGGGSLSGATPGNYLITVQAGNGFDGSIVSTTNVAVTVQ